MTTGVIDERQEKRREARIRRELDRSGYFLRKSRLHGWPRPGNYGEYMIVDATTNFAVAGWDSDYSLDDVEAWMQETA